MTCWKVQIAIFRVFSVQLKFIIKINLPISFDFFNVTTRKLKKPMWFVLSFYWTVLAGPGFCALCPGRARAGADSAAAPSMGLGCHQLHTVRLSERKTLLFPASLLLVYMSVLLSLLHTLDQLSFAPFAFAIAANSLSLFWSSPPTDGQLVLAFKRCQGRQGVAEACVGVCGMPDIWAAGKLLHQLWFLFAASIQLFGSGDRRLYLTWKCVGKAVFIQLQTPRLKVGRVRSWRLQWLTDLNKLLDSENQAETHYWREQNKLNSSSQTEPLQSYLRFALAFHVMETLSADTSLSVTLPGVWMASPRNL